MITSRQDFKFYIMEIIAQFEKGTFWNNRDGYRIIKSNNLQYPEGIRFDYNKAIYECELSGTTLTITLIH